jgi:S1-C subfamily serine protease
MSDSLRPEGEDAFTAGPPPPVGGQPPSWGQLPLPGAWPPSASSAGGRAAAWGAQGWTSPPWDPAYDAPRRRRSHAALAIVVASAIAGVAGAAVVVGGHGVSTTITSPFRSIGLGGASSPGGTSTGVLPAGSSAADIAAHVDGAVVDINCTVPGGEAAGTGIVLTSSGEVLTNNHVVDGATAITVQVDGQGPVYTASVRGVDVADDVAVLQIDNVSGIEIATLGDSSANAVGEAVIAIGNAGGQGGTPAMSQGAITALGQTITASDGGAGGSSETLNGLIQFNAPIQPGDSGGPLVNSSGQIIGMDTAASGGRHFRREGAISTAGFAIPINTAKTIAAQIESGSGGTNVAAGQTAFLGVELQDSLSASGSGAYVAGVQPGGPADNAGIAAGDTITSFAGEAVDSSTTLGREIHAHHPGDRVTVGWVDGEGTTQSATVQLASGPPA